MRPHAGLRGVGLGGQRHIGDLLEQVAGPFAVDHPDVQIAIVGDGVGSDRTHVEVLGRIACLAAPDRTM